MKIHGITPILNVSDVPASLAWFEKLGWKRSFTWNGSNAIVGAADSDAHGRAKFGGVGFGKLSIFLCQDAQGSRGGATPRHAGDDDSGGVWMSWWLGSPAEVDELHALALRAGVTVVKAPTDEPWGVRECQIVHLDGHTIRLSAGLGGAEHDPESAARAFVAAINSGRPEAIAALISADHVFVDSLGKRIEGRAAVQQAWAGYFAMVPDYRIEIEHITVGEQRVLLSGMASGGFAPDGVRSRTARWSTPATWEARGGGGRVSHWQVFCDNEPLRALMRSTATD